MIRLSNFTLCVMIVRWSSVRLVKKREAKDVTRVRMDTSLIQRQVNALIQPAELNIVRNVTLPVSKAVTSVEKDMKLTNSLEFARVRNV